jgi:hypothetical protein
MTTPDPPPAPVAEKIASTVPLTWAMVATRSDSAFSTAGSTSRALNALGKASANTATPTMGANRLAVLGPKGGAPVGPNTVLPGCKTLRGSVTG